MAYSIQKNRNQRETQNIKSMGADSQAEAEVIRRRAGWHSQKHENNLKEVFFSRSMPDHLRSMAAGGQDFRRRWLRMLLAGENPRAEESACLPVFMLEGSRLQ